MNIIPNTIVNEDILKVLPQIPDGIFDAVISDPPYQIEVHGRGIGGKRKIYTDMAKWTNLENDWYSEDILNEFTRICKFPNVFLFCGKRDVYNVLKYAVEHKYHYHIIPLCKKTPIPMTDNTWLNNEYAVHYTDRRVVFTKDYNVKIPYFIVGQEKETQHPNEKPIRVLKRIIMNLTPEDGFVFDGFMGSGSTALACQQLKRKFFGCEIDETFVSLANSRLQEDEKQLDLF